MNIRQMMKQAQAMQEKVQQELAALRVEGSAGGGAVRIEMSGAKELLSCRFDPELVDSADLEMLQDLVLAAAREATRRVDEEVESRTSRMLGGLRVPGM
jgi:DNA-binding YbaB/EbfC family protein